MFRKYEYSPYFNPEWTKYSSCMDELKCFWKDNHEYLRINKLI